MSRDADWQTDLARCRAQLSAGSKSFTAASRLLPAEVRDAATVLYAFCREADDLVDLHQGDTTTIASLRARVDSIASGRPLDHPCDRAMAVLFARYRLPRAPLDALIEGFDWDARARRYETLAELEAYAARVAGTVGALMAALMGTRTASAIARACELGVAMQLSNIARDVGEDARNGRIYLPLAWLREAGIDSQTWLADPRHSAALGTVVQRLLAVAERLYAGVGAGIAELPAGCRAGIGAARLIYAEIGCAVARAGHNSVSRRAVVSTSRKLVLLMQALLFAPREDAETRPPLPAIQFLVDAVALPAPRRLATAVARADDMAWWRLGARWLRVIELFERIERGRRLARATLDMPDHGAHGRT